MALRLAVLGPQSTQVNKIGKVPPVTGFCSLGDMRIIKRKNIQYVAENLDRK